MKVYIIQPDGSVRALEAEKELTRDTLATILGGDREHVRVLFNGQVCSMFVHERGIEAGLPINARATAIYWTATIQGRTGVTYDPLHEPLIHGPAVLYDRDVWK